MSDEQPSGPPPTQPAPPPGQWSSIPPPGLGVEQRPASGLDAMIPTSNPPSLVSYYCGVFSLTMCFSPILSPIAIIYGRKALKNLEANPRLGGKGHAKTGIILGTVSLTLTLLAAALIWWSASHAANPY